MVAAAGALVQGACGFGFALVAAPLLLLLDPRLVPGPLLVAVWCLAALMVRSEEATFYRKEVAAAVLGSFPGALLGAWALKAFSPDALSVTVGLGVLAAVVASLFVFELTPTIARTAVAGIASGVMGTITSMGGPPLAILYQRESGRRVRGVFAGYFLLGTLLSLGALGIGGSFGRQDLVYGLTLVPGVLAGFALSRPLGRRVDEGYLRGAVLVLATMAGIVILARELA